MKLRLNDHILLSNEVLECLKRRSIYNVADLLASDLNEIHRNENISLRTLYKIRDHYLTTSSLQQTNAFEEYEKVLQTSFIISTGSEDLDEALDGGWYSGEVNLLVGKHACIDHFLAMIDNNVSIAFIGTGGQFEFVEIAASLPGVMVLNISDIFEFFDAIAYLKTTIESGRVKVVVVGCLEELLKPLSNSKLKSELSAKFTEMVRALRRLCACDVVGLLCTCEGRTGRLVKKQLLRQFDNVIEVSGDETKTYELSVLKANEMMSGTTVSIAATR